LHGLVGIANEYCGIRCALVWGTCLSSSVTYRSQLTRAWFVPQHCRNLAPEYEKAAKSFNGLVPLYAVDCDAEANKPLCGQQVRVVAFTTVLANVRCILGRARVSHCESERKGRDLHFREIRGRQ